MRGGYINRRQPAASEHDCVFAFGRVILLETDVSHETLRIAALAPPATATRRNVKKWLASEPTAGFTLDISWVDNLRLAMDALAEFEVDLLAVDAATWFDLFPESDPADFPVATSLARREANLILCADDRPGYLVHNAIVFCEDLLATHQLVRYRPDVNFVHPTAWAEKMGLPAPSEDPVERVEWMEALRGGGAIDGFVIPRHLYTDANLNCRRTTLTSDVKEGDSHRFLPRAMAGLTLLVSRPAFPESVAERLGDAESLTAWRCERILAAAVAPEHADNVGMLVRHRQVPSLLRQAEQERDLMRARNLLDEEGEIRDPEPKVELMIELVQPDGKRTLVIERLVPLTESMTAARFMVNDWNIMVDKVLEAHPEDVRLGPARPPFFDL